MQTPATTSTHSSPKQRSRHKAIPLALSCSNSPGFRGFTASTPRCFNSSCVLFALSCSLDSASARTGPAIGERGETTRDDFVCACACCCCCDCGWGDFGEEDCGWGAGSCFNSCRNQAISASFSLSWLSCFLVCSSICFCHCTLAS